MTTATSGIAPIYLAVGDYNQDGRPDVAIPDYAGKTISVYSYQQSGTFAAPIVTTVAIDNTLGSVITGDFNEDGKPDLVVSTVAGDQTSIVLLGNGDGTFTVKAPLPGSFGFISGKVADFNGDKHADLFLDGNGSPNLYLGKGDGTFTRGSLGTSLGGGFTGASVADFNGDGFLDGVLVDYGNPAHAAGHIEIFPGAAGGSFGNANVLQPTAIENPEAVDTADFNGDGRADLLISSNGGAFVCPGNGDGTFQFQSCVVIGEYPGFGKTNVTNPDTPNVLAADLDQDGTADVVMVESLSGQLSLILNDGTGTFLNALATPLKFTLPVGSYNAAIADFNGDGLPDIAAVSESGQFLSLLLSVKDLANSSVSLSSSGNSLLIGSPLVFKIAVSGGTEVPTGSVSLLDGGSQIGQQTLDATGSVTFTVSSLSAGMHTLTAAYAGDVPHAAATSASLVQQVTDFSASVSPAAQTVSAESSAAYTLTVTPQGGFTGIVTVACQGLPSGASCNAASLQVASGTATVSVIVTAESASAAGLGQAGVLIYVGLLLGCLVPGGRHRKSFPWYVRGAPVLFVALILGCSGGSKTTPPAVSAGPSTIVFAATATQNGVLVTHTATATLTVH